MTRSVQSSSTSLGSTVFGLVVPLALSVLVLLAVSPSAHAATQADIVGTWSTGNAAVLTGPTFGKPFNSSFNYPTVAGYSFSFTADGYFEQAQFTWNSNATHHNCIEAVVLWQHGTYSINKNGSLTTDPSVFPGDGKIQVQNACSQTTTNVYYYQEPGLYANFAVGDWRGKDMLRLAQFDGQLMPRMFLVSRDPSGYMFPTEYITNTSTGTFEIH
ncbi:hypothetical protein JCM3766R1_000176 [Sporobolomyces carnicolor]